MKHYFLTGLNDKQKIRLTDSLVVYSDMVIGDRSGLLFDEANKDSALQVLNLVEKKQAATVYDGIVEIVYGAAEAGPQDNSPAGPSMKTDVVKAARPELDEEHKRYRALYIEACSTRINELVVQNRQVISTERSQIERLQRELVLELRAIRLEEGRAAGAPLVDAEAFAQEFDAIFSVPKVKDVQVEDGVISVVTETLFAYDPRSRKNHELGEYVIQFFTDGQSDCVRWFNKSRRVDGGRSAQQAPHVFASGRSRLHAIKESLVDLVAELQFAVATQLAIDFIEQVDVDEPDGAMLDKWPEEKKPDVQNDPKPADKPAEAGSDGATNLAIEAMVGGTANAGATGTGTSSTGPR